MRAMRQRLEATALQVELRRISTDATYYLVRHFSVLRSLIRFTTHGLHRAPSVKRILLCNCENELFVEKVCEKIKKR